MALSTNLQSYYKFEGNSNDAVGSANGTDTSITYNTGNGVISQGAGFGGSSLINLGNTQNFTTGAFSVAGWFKCPNKTTYRQIIGKTQSAGTPDWGLRAESGTGHAQFIVTQSGGGADSVTGSIDICDGNWHHVVALRDGSFLRLYVDGVADGTATDNARNCSNSLNCKFGIDDGGNFQVPNGTTFDEWGIWSRGITAAEVTQLFNNRIALGYPFTGVIYDNATYSAVSSAAPTKTFAHTVTTNSDRILFVTACEQSGQSISGVTYNGVAMTKLGEKVQTGGGVRVSLWYLFAPATGTNNVVITANATHNIVGYAASYYQADTVNTPSFVATGDPSNTVTSLTQTITNSLNGCLAISGIIAASGSALTAGTATGILFQPEVLAFGNALIESSVAQVTAGSQSLIVTSSAQILVGVMATFGPVVAASTRNSNFFAFF